MATVIRPCRSKRRVSGQWSTGGVGAGGLTLGEGSGMLQSCVRLCLLKDR